MQRVSPSFIRVEADEVTYDLHILLRFEMELALIEGRLKVKDLPEAWNTRFYELFGLIVPDDAAASFRISIGVSVPWVTSRPTPWATSMRHS